MTLCQSELDIHVVFAGEVVETGSLFKILQVTLAFSFKVSVTD
jgi:hypothetical protein